VWPPFYAWFQATKSLYIAGAEPWPQCTVSQSVSDIETLFYMPESTDIYIFTCAILCAARLVKTTV